MKFQAFYRPPDKVRIFISIMFISSPNPMFDHLLESSHRDDSNKWSNIEFGEEITQVDSIEVNFMHLIWSSGFSVTLQVSGDSDVNCIMLIDQAVMPTHARLVKVQ